MAMTDLTTMFPVTPALKLECEEDHPDAPLVKMFNKRQEVLAAMEGRGSFYYAERHSPKEADLFNTLEDGFRFVPSNSLLGVLAKLWIALSHIDGEQFTPEQRAAGDTVRRCDVDSIATFANDFDFGPQLVFQAIQELTSQLRFVRVERVGA